MDSGAHVYARGYHGSAHEKVTPVMDPGAPVYAMGYHRGGAALALVISSRESCALSPEGVADRCSIS